MIKKLLRRSKYLLMKLLRLHDSAHSVALGFSLGLLVNFIPSFGLGPVVSVTFAKLFRGNAIAGLVGGLSLIWAFPILFYLNTLVGHLFFPIEVDDFTDHLGEADETVEFGLQLGKAFIAGMIANMIIAGIIIYFSSYIIIKNYRVKLLHYIGKNWKISK
ncbi:DUF2062 domain-containing protein [Aeribacillus pallidus]|uniref:DUF2062 domain-containing protein n=1 Tax=Aeribacillus pallidus TaxID=33936 RepID=UPI001E614D35|nr:DUF2062 domain-containing protein [Aeribacillus pallidus]